MVDLNHGLFICNKLNPYREKVGKRFCRVIGVSVYVTHLRTKPMLIAYKIGWWDEEPKTMDDFSNVTVFRNSVTDSIINVFEHDRVYLNRDELITVCNRHFLNERMFEDTTKILSEELNSLFFCPVRRFKDSIVNVGQTAAVWNVYHKTRYESTNGQAPILQENILKYRGNFLDNGSYAYDWEYGEDGYISFSQIWVNDLPLAALNHFDNQTTIDYCDVNFLGVPV